MPVMSERYLYQSLCTSEIQVKSPPHRMSSFTVGSRVLFYDSSGRLAGGVVELTSVMGNVFHLCSRGVAKHTGTTACKGEDGSHLVQVPVFKSEIAKGKKRR
ncbi:hypothetical protein EDD18DRAFT_1109154 [Armillaria luteobubalina]|uniref:Uncharacterized protein n=1 Tax=Armillaria luteobubalina TaxID=153913 RepID=A0AA39PYL0_9AGAR|nr:hypothetical protein EDD18DRAFT_1109154 [Armillaria luteobubalina]